MAATPDQELDQRLQPGLARLREQDRYRQRRIFSSADNMQLRNGDGRWLNFSSNDYLGLSRDPRLIQSFRNAAKRYGVGAGASHLITGHTPAHHALEEELADFLQRPRALLFSTGFMANLGIASALLDRSHCLATDRLNHASLLDAAAQSGADVRRYQHASLDSAGQQLERCHGNGNWLVTDGVFSMDGDMAPLAELATLCTQKHATMWVDDAHGFGVLGRRGRGSLEASGVENQYVPVLMCTLGKALGTAGAVVAGSEALVETLLQAARSYVYTTAMPAAVAEASRTALHILRDEPWRRQVLQDRIQQLCAGLENISVPVVNHGTPIIPVLLGTDSKAVTASKKLAERGFQVSAIRPPTVAEGSARLRITLSASHTEEQVNRLLDTLAELLR